MEKLYYNGDIITMEQENGYAEGVLVSDGRIRKVGTLKELEPYVTPKTERIDLNGSTLMPAFIDSHSHITAFAGTMGAANLGAAGSFEEIIDIMNRYIVQEKAQDREFIIGFGYDQNNLTEGKHPAKDILDRCNTDKPMIIVHASGHMGVVNSKALSILNIDRDTADPAGGVIGRYKGTGEPDGYLEERAFMQYTKAIPVKSPEDMMRDLKKAQQIYLSYGITTVQDGLTGEREYGFLEKAAEEGVLLVDVVGYIDLNKAEQLTERGGRYMKEYSGHFKLGGYKIFLDGSPQGLTAWLSRPYEGRNDGYCGYPVYDDEEVKRFIETAKSRSMQLLVHCTGDAACEQLIRSYNSPAADRPVMIHAQTVREDQLVRMKELGIIPSFFIAHTYYWGDIHRKNLGEERAAGISPAKTAVRLSMPYTLHQDTPVILPDMLETVWCAVNRRTRSGHVLGAGQRIPVYEALKAVTINAAYQYFEEDRKGSLKEGKLADLVILSGNPLKTDPLRLKEIKVLETIKEGVTLYEDTKTPDSN